MPTTRKDFLKTVMKGAVAVSLPAYLQNISCSTPKGYRPNILWITMEDTCLQFIGCYGNKDARTPNMDQLASGGVRFDRAFSTAPVCAPSRFSIITGCSAEMAGTGHHRSHYPLPEFIKGFPYYLRDAGYFTSNNLKTDYNLGNTGEFIDQAWDECHGVNGWGTSFGINKDTFDESSQEAGWWHRKEGQPFFSVFNLMNSHQSRTMTHPYKWYEQNVLQKLPERLRIKPDEITVPPFYRDTPDMRQQLCRVYNSLQYTDREFGSILERLEEDGLEEDTIIFCFADHGEGIPGAKMSAIGLGFQVPFFMYFPPKLQHLSPWPIGKPTQELISSSEDIAPTILSLAGVRIPEYMTGRPLLGEQRKAPRPFVFCARNRIDESPDLSRCVTDGSHFYTRVYMPQLPLVKFAKYMEVGDIMRKIRSDYESGLLNETQARLIKPDQPVEYLFDLKNDLWQINNLVKDPKYQDQLKKMRTALQGHLQKTRDIHFMPEYEMDKRSKVAPPYKFRMDNHNYPFARILHVANMVGNKGDVSVQLKYLKDDDPTVRFWAANGLDYRGEELRPYKTTLLESLNDPHPSVRIVMAGIIYKLYENIEAFNILKDFLNNENKLLVLHALQTIEYLRNMAEPFASVLKKRLEDHTNEKNINYNIKSIMDVTLHFLEGTPLYYNKFKAWMPKRQLEVNKSVHFMG